MAGMSYVINLNGKQLVLDEFSVVIFENYRKTVAEIGFLTHRSASTVFHRLDILLLMIHEAGIDSKFPVVADKVVPQIREQREKAARRTAA